MYNQDYSATGGNRRVTAKFQFAKWHLMLSISLKDMCFFYARSYPSFFYAIRNEVYRNGKQNQGHNRNWRRYHRTGQNAKKSCGNSEQALSILPLIAILGVFLPDSLSSLKIENYLRIRLQKVALQRLQTHIHWRRQPLCTTGFQFYSNQSMPLFIAKLGPNDSKHMLHFATHRRFLLLICRCRLLELRETLGCLTVRRLMRCSKSLKCTFSATPGCFYLEITGISYATSASQISNLRSAQCRAYSLPLWQGYAPNRCWHLHQRDILCRIHIRPPFSPGAFHKRHSTKRKLRLKVVYEHLRY